MTRISGMILGLGLMIVISSLASPASAWDDDDDDHRSRRFRSLGDVDDDDDFRRFRSFGDIDDDDGDFRRRRGGIPPIFRQPRRVPRHHYAPMPRYRSGYEGPRFAPPQRQPIAPPPPPLEDFHRGGSAHHQEELVVPQAPPSGAAGPPDHSRPGQFVNAAVPLYPHVRVKDADEAPRRGVHRILAVKSPDPARFPGCVYVKVLVPPVPCREVKVDKGGAEIELKYEDLEVEIKSRRGVVTVEYDD